MQYRIAVEDIELDHYVAWVLDLPGCFSSASTSTAAVAAVPTQIVRYFAWLRTYASTLPLPDEPMTINVVETFRAYLSPDDPDYLINACFLDDQRPISYGEAVFAQRLAQWSLTDLLQLLPPHMLRNLRQLSAGEAWTALDDILRHLARAEHWYLDQLDLALDWSTLPDDSLAKFVRVRQHTCNQLPRLIGDEHITENRGEQWSARKVIRRMLWHGRDHIQQITQMLTQLTET